MATVTCSRCGKNFKSTQQYCPDCGTQNKQTKLLSSSAPTQNVTPSIHATQPVAPPVPLVTPPEDFQNPSSEQILQALLATSNPYSPLWGTLLYDDSQRFMWPKLHEALYAGSVCRFPTHIHGYSREILVHPDTVIDTIGVNINLVSPKKKRSFFGNTPAPLPTPKRSPYARNFAYQVQVKIPREKIEAGLICRSDDLCLNYYKFTIQGENFSFSTKDSKPLVEDHSDAIQLGKPNLLAVVIQEATIYLYANLQLIATLIDTSLLHAGKVGIFTRDYSPGKGNNVVEFSYAKVWVKG